MTDIIKRDDALNVINAIDLHEDTNGFEALSHAYRDIALLPTVEAIPIEWIETEIQRFKEGKTPENHADIFAAVLQGMIDAWRKEK